MKKNIVIIFVLSMLMLSTIQIVNNNNIVSAIYYDSPDSRWEYKRTITIDHTKVISTLTNFPVLIDITNSTFVHAQNDGDDFIFCVNGSDTLFNFEIESFSDNHLIAWVKIPTLSSTTDTLIDLYYGNPNATTQQNINGVWDNNYVSVYHFNSSKKNIDSSCTYYNLSTDSIPSTINGYINGGIRCGLFNFQEYHSTLNMGSDSDSFTVELWHKSAQRSYIDNYPCVTNYAVSSQNGFYMLGSDDGTTMFWWMRNNAKTSSIKSTEREPAYDGNYHYYVGQKDDNLGKSKFFIDGALKDNLTFNSDCQSSGSYFSINKHASTLYNNGSYDEIRVSNNVRSDDWINTTFNTIYYRTTFISVGIEKYTQHIKPVIVYSIYPVNNSVVTVDIVNIINITTLRLEHYHFSVYRQGNFDTYRIADYNFNTDYTFTGNNLQTNGSWYFSMNPINFYNTGNEYSIHTCNTIFRWFIIAYDSIGNTYRFPTTDYYRFTTWEENETILPPSLDINISLHYVNNFKSWSYVEENMTYQTIGNETNDNNWSTYSDLSGCVVGDIVYTIPDYVTGIQWHMKDSDGEQIIDFTNNELLNITKILAEENLTIHVYDACGGIYYSLYYDGDYHNFKSTWTDYFYEDSIIWNTTKQDFNKTISKDLFLDGWFDSIINNSCENYWFNYSDDDITINISVHPDNETENLSYLISDNIYLIPIMSTISLMGIGLIMVRRRKRNEP